MKQIKVPVLPHLKKFVELEYPTRNGVVIIERKIIPPRWLNSDDCRKYFEQPSEKYIEMLVETNDSRLYKVYAWIQSVDARFREKLVDYIYVRHGIQSVSDSIRDFLALYSIYESEYGWWTAHKLWQRSKPYKLLKECRLREERETTLEDWLNSITHYSEK